jgi:hypothetical protein
LWSYFKDIFLGFIGQLNWANTSNICGDKINQQPRNMETQLMEKDKNIEFDENKDRRIQYCQNAPEWAEHARFLTEDEPCDDGRTGRICGSRKGEKPCPI